ncbi:phosphoenolpyruvate carboxylase kinase 1 [Tanacetum coccineum]
MYTRKFVNLKDHGLGEFLCRSLVAGVAHMHSRKVVHRNINPKNIMVDNNDRAKICGFRNSILLINGQPKGRIIDPPPPRGDLDKPGHRSWIVASPEGNIVSCRQRENDKDMYRYKPDLEREVVFNLISIRSSHSARRRVEAEAELVANRKNDVGLKVPR